MRNKEEDIVYENGDFWVLKHSESRFECRRNQSSGLYAEFLGEAKSFKQAVRFTDRAAQSMK